MNFLQILLGECSHLWPSVVIEKNSTTNKYVSPFSSIGQFLFIKQLMCFRKSASLLSPLPQKIVVRTSPTQRRVLDFCGAGCPGFHHSMFLAWLNVSSQLTMRFGEPASFFSPPKKIIARTSPARGFLRYWFSRFWPLHACLLRHLITADNMLQEITSPPLPSPPFLHALCSILQSSVRRRKSHVAVTFRWPKSTEIVYWTLTYDIPTYAAIFHTVRRQFSSMLSRIARIFVPLMDLGPEWDTISKWRINFDSSDRYTCHI